MLVGGQLGAAQLVGKQAAQPQQAGLQSKRIQGRTMPEGAQLGQTMKRPNVLLVTQAPEQPLPQRLFPPDLAGAGGVMAGFDPPADVRRGQKEFGQAPGRQAGEGGGALAAQRHRQAGSRFATEGFVEFSQGSVEAPLQGQHREPFFGARGSRPDHVQNDAVVIGVAVMAMGFPAAGLQIDLDIPGERGLGAQPDHCVPKIRPGLLILKTRVKNPHRPPVQGDELVPQ